MLKFIYYAIVTGFAIYAYPDLMGLFAKSGNDFPIVFGSFSFITNPMTLLCLGIAVLFCIFLPRLWKKFGLLKLPARTFFFLSVGYIASFVYSLLG